METIYFVFDDQTTNKNGWHDLYKNRLNQNMNGQKQIKM